MNRWSDKDPLLSEGLSPGGPGSSLAGSTEIIVGVTLGKIFRSPVRRSASETGKHLNMSPRYDWNTFESGVRHHSINSLP